MALDKIAVVDVEATCWRGYPPKGQANQIIEVGICLLDIKTLEISDKRSILIKPSKSKVSKFCTELTTITQEMLDEQGVSFKEACDTLVADFNTKKRVWASFGDYDRNIFRKNCQDQRVDYPFSKKHINIKLLFALVEGLDRESGVQSSLKLLELPFEGTHHRGVDDAWNTAKIMAHCLGR